MGIIFAVLAGIVGIIIAFKILKAVISALLGLGAIVVGLVILGILVVIGVFVLPPLIPPFFLFIKPFLVVLIPIGVISLILALAIGLYVFVDGKIDNKVFATIVATLSMGGTGFLYFRYADLLMNYVVR